MDNKAYLKWFANYLEEQFNSYGVSKGDEKEGRREGIKNFLIAQKPKIEKMIDILEFTDGRGTSLTWANIIEPYFFDSDIEEFIRQLKDNLNMDDGK